MKKFLSWAAVGGCLWAIAIPSSAGETEDALVARVVAAYGGNTLVNLETLEFTDRTQRLRFGQSVSPDEVDINFVHATTVIDFANRRKSWRSATWFGAERYTQNQFFDGERGFGINHTARTYGENSAFNFAGADRRMSYTLDTVLARMLHDNAASANHAGEELLDGTMLQKLTFSAEGHPPLTLYINPETGVISKATRPHWMEGKVFSYRFSRHKKVGDILYASDTYALNRGRPSTITVSREVSLTPDMDGLFDVPADYSQEGQAIDFSEMSAEEIGEGVYIAGQNWGFSLFVDEGEYFTAAGGYAGFTDRFNAVKALTGMDKPVRYFVVSHHHQDHIGGVREIADLGAAFIVHRDHLETLETTLGEKLDENRRILVTGPDARVGRVQVIDIPSGHTTHNLGTHVIDGSLMFTADTFFSRQVEGGVRGDRSLVEALERLGIMPERFVAAHSPKQLTYRDLQDAVATEEADRCPDGWSICSQ